MADNKEAKVMTSKNVVSPVRDKKDEKGNIKIFAKDMVDFQFNDKSKHHSEGSIVSIHNQLAIKFVKKGIGEIVGITEKPEASEA